ncbi:MAG: protein O-mannosyl-transferase [Verrucomicrobiota bacterium]
MHSQLERQRERIHAIFFGVAIVVAALVAHGGCVRAIFYLDDWWQIVDSDFIETGKWWTAGANALTCATYYLTWRIAGYSPQAFHLGNLLLHIGLALIVYRCSHVFWPDSLPDQKAAFRRLAGLGAIIFAVHPLTSEITHYARARDHELVALFSFLAAVCAALWIRRGWRWFPALAICILAAALSKGPGIWHAMINVGIVLVCLSRVSDWRARFPTRWWIYGSILFAEGVVAICREQVTNLLLLSVNQVRDWRFGWHLLTQSRVIWRYAWRMIVPVRLCSDHLVAWTKSLADVSAWVGLIGVILWIALTVWLWCRHRRFEALLSAMILAPLLLRFGYVVSELMVEYRTYPAMPWVGLLFARVLLGYQFRWPKLTKAAALTIVLLFAALTHFRSRDWESVPALTGNILAQYPLQLRAYNEKSSEDIRQGRYQAVIARRDEFFGKLDQLLAINRSDKLRYYDNWPLGVVCEDCNIADALLEIEGPEAARKALEGTARQMRGNNVKNDDLWALWHFSMGKTELRAGHAREADWHFDRIDPAFISGRAVERAKLRK